MAATVIDRRQYLLTTARHFRGDVAIDRGWTVVREKSGRMVAITTDGVTVEGVFSAGRLWSALPSSVLHMGSGYEAWTLAERVEVDALVMARGLRFVGCA